MDEFEIIRRLFTPDKKSDSVIVGVGDQDASVASLPEIERYDERVRRILGHDGRLAACQNPQCDRQYEHSLTSHTLASFLW